MAFQGNKSMSKRRSSKLSLNQRLTLFVAALAIAGTLLAAFVSGHDWFPSGSPAASVLSPTPFSGTLEFVSPENPEVLHSDLQWEAGSSVASDYSIEGDTLALTAGPHTWPHFPMIDYKQPIRGDFSVQVKVVFVPEATVIQNAQMVGLLVRPVHARLVQSDTSFPGDWVVSSKYVTDAGLLIGCRGSWNDYSSSESLYLKIERGAGTWRCAYSDNGENWLYLNAEADETQLPDQPFVISLFAYSDTDEAIRATFSNWELYTNGKQ